MKNISILFEDNYILVLNKESGIMVEEDKAGNPSLIRQVYDYLSTKSVKEPFVENAHRLDRPTSGTIVFAKKKLALKNLHEQFRNRTITKTYWAITNSLPKANKGKLIHYHKKDTLAKKAIISDIERSDMQKVELEYSILSSKNGYHLWSIKLITGKYHQIRAQLSFISCPIVGDILYGSEETYKENQVCLHSRYLKIKHPISSEVLEFTSSPPAIEPYRFFS